MKRAAFVAAPLVLALALACGGQKNDGGAAEPIQVHGAALIAGELPGAPPSPGGGSSGPNAITNLTATNTLVLPGQAGKRFQGRVADSASSIAIRLADEGSGYWVLPLGPPDPQYPGELSWEAAIDFSAQIPAGNHPLRVVAIDASGSAGQEAELSLCVASRVPDNLHACDPTLAPPEAVISLTWDDDADLDLQVVTPDGRLVEPKHPTTADLDGGKPGPEVGVIDRDSLAGCFPDGLREEDLVFAKRPTGTFSVYVNLFDACKQPGARFTVVVYEAQGDGPARTLVETYRQAGRLADIDANGGAAIGLFVVDYPF